MQDALFRSWGPEVTRLTVSPLSDIHIGSPQFAAEEYYAWIKAIAEDPTHYVVLNGDYIDAVTRSSVGDIWSATMTPTEQIRAVAKSLEPIRDRILAITTGNHDERTAKDTSIDAAMLIAGKLDLEDAVQADGAAIIVQFGRAEDRGSARGKPKQQTYRIYAYHGRSGGRLPGAKMIAVDRMARVIANADVLMMGHVHDLMSRKITVQSFEDRSRKIRPRLQAQLIAGAFLHYGGYGQRFGYAPGAIGMPRVVLYGDHYDMDVII